MGGSKKKSLNSYSRRLTNTFKKAGESSSLPNNQQPEPEGVTQKLNRLRAEEARKKGIQSSWNDFESSISSQQYLDADPLQRFSSQQTFGAGPKPPNSWIASSINRPNESATKKFNRSDTLYAQCLNFIFTDFIATKRILERLEFLPCRVKKDMILVILPRLPEPDLALSLFKDLSYESLSFEDCTISSTALISFLGKPADSKCVPADEWEELADQYESSAGHSFDYESACYLPFLTKLSLCGCLALDAKIAKHLSSHFPQLVYLNLDRTFSSYPEEKLSHILNLLGAGLIHLRFLSLNNNAWISDRLLFQINWKTGYPSLEQLSLRSCSLPDLTELTTRLHKSRPRLRLLV